MKRLSVLNVLLVFTLLLAALPAAAQQPTAAQRAPVAQRTPAAQAFAAPQAESSQPQTLQPTLTAPVQAVSMDLDLRAIEAAQKPAVVEKVTELELPEPRGKAAREGDGTLAGPATDLASVQRAQGAEAMPATSVQFDGLNNAMNGQVFGFTVNPPDTIGDVGPNHYIQQVNLTFGIFNKAGARLVGPLKLSSLFAAGPTGTPCDLTDHGDPIVLYDSMADRWLLSQFSVPGPDYYECIAVSKTGDPVSGGWWLYVVPAPFRVFIDYPKLSVWTGSYLITAPMFADTGPVTGAVYALERQPMLSGRPTRGFYFDVGTAFPRLLPSNLRGEAPPPGSPAFLLSYQLPDKLAFWTLDVDWSAPSAALNGPTLLTVNTFAEACPNTRDCIPFTGGVAGSTYLDDLSPRLMQQLQYRRVASSESLWANQTVTESGKTAVRWYELRIARAGSAITPSVHQQSTFNPADGVWRWMGSLAADKDGNMALGYSGSSPSTNPDIRYVGRLASDPLNTLGQSELVMVAGTGHPTTTNSRWGDYSSMTVDPVDDCTFWYTTEYYTQTASSPWNTRVGAFKYPSCTPLPATGTLSGQVTETGSGLPIAGVSVQAYDSAIHRVYDAVSDAGGNYAIKALPGSYAMSAGPLDPGYPVGASASGVAVVSSSTTTQNFQLGPAPDLNAVSSTLVDPAPGGNVNNAPEPGEKNLQLSVTLANTGAANASNVNATLSALTPGVAVVNASGAYGTINKGASSSNLAPFTFNIDGGLVCGKRIQFSLLVSSDQGSFTTGLGLDTGAIGAPVNYVSASGVQGIPAAPNGVDIAIGARQTVTIPADYAVHDARVTMTINHPNDADVQVHLESPLGTAVHLTSDNGGTGDNYTNTLFDDAAATRIQAGAAPFTGSFRPESPLSALHGERSAGTWSLRAFDATANASAGSMQAFTLTLVPLVCTFPVANLNVNNTAFAERGGNSNLNGAIDPGENSIDLRVALNNAGLANLTAATGVSGTITPLTAGVTMNRAASSYPDIAVSGVQTNTLSYNFGLVTGVACGTPLRFSIQANSAQGNFNRTFSLPTGTAELTPNAVLTDTVEAGPWLWTTSTSNPAFGFVISTEAAHSPTHAWNDSPGALYPNAAQTALISPSFDLILYDTLLLSFYHQYDLEQDFDYGFVEVSTDGGSTWNPVPAAAFTGSSTGFVQDTVDLSAYLAHQGAAAIRFRMETDSSVNQGGWVIDDIHLYGIMRSCEAPNSDLLFAPMLAK